MKFDSACVGLILCPEPIRPDLWGEKNINQKEMFQKYFIEELTTFDTFSLADQML